MANPKAPLFPFLIEAGFRSCATNGSNRCAPISLSFDCFATVINIFHGLELINLRFFEFESPRPTF